MVVEDTAHGGFAQPAWRPCAAKKREPASKGTRQRPHSAQASTRQAVNPWAAATEGRKPRSRLQPRPEFAKTSPAAVYKTPWNAGGPEGGRRLAARLASNVDTITCDPQLPPGHPAIGNFAMLAKPATMSFDGSQASVTDGRLDHLQRLVQHKFECQSGGNVLLPAFRKLSHQCREDDPSHRRAHPRDLAFFLGDCGAHATEAEAAQLLVNARSGSSSNDGCFGIRTFHDLARGVNAGRAASEGRPTLDNAKARAFGRTMAPPRPQSASRESGRPPRPQSAGGAQVHRDSSRSRAFSVERGGCAGKVGSCHWTGQPQQT